MHNRQQQIVRTGYWGIIVNVAVSVVKAIVGIIAGSMAIVLDAVNNITDALSSVITIVGVKLAGRPANDKHPFGYGRIEYFTAVVIAIIILLTGGILLIESIKDILHPKTLEYSIVGLCFVGGTIVVKYFLGLYTKRKGKELSSDSLTSSGIDSLSDCVVSLATLVSACLFFSFGWAVDSWLAAVISCVIIKAGFEMLISPINELLGVRNDHKLVANIKSKVNEIMGVRGTYDVVLHDYGPEQKIGALHVEVDDTMSAAEMHQLTRKIQQTINLDWGIYVTVGFYAHHPENSEAGKEEAQIRNYVMRYDGVVGMHGFYVNHDDKILSFDIVYSFKVKQPIALRTEIKNWVQQLYADYDINIALDRNYNEAIR